MTTAQTTDVIIGGGGTIYTVMPVTEAARNWIDEHVSDEASYLGRALCVEHRFIMPLVEGMIDDGLEVR